MDDVSSKAPQGTNDGNAPTTYAAEPRSAPLMYWGLILLAAAGLVPSVVLPEWRQYERLKIAQQYERYRLEQVQAQVDRERRLLEAVRTDPAVVYRIAERELGLHPEGDRYIDVEPVTASTASEGAFVPVAIEPPSPVRRVTALLPSFNYDGVFCDEGARRLVIALSVALMCVAFVLYARASGEKAS